jgi:2,3-dimethylmalate lyase
MPDTSSFSTSLPAEFPAASKVRASTRLRALLSRPGHVTSILHPPTASLARIMDQAGCEVGFVGTGGVVGGYTGLADIGTADMMECVTIAGWIASSVSFPVMLDGDTGHGGIMAVRRLVRESIRAGLAGIRIDDQPIEGKRRTGTAGIDVVPLEQAIARYRAAVDMRNELDPDFVIMAQCYARKATNGGLENCLDRMSAYEKDGGVDWVQFEAPQSVEEIRQARARIDGLFSFMKGGLPRYLTLDEQRDLGANAAWLPSFTHHVIWAALSDFMTDFQERGIAAWDDFVASRADRPYREPVIGPAGEGQPMQAQLEERYFSGRPSR